ncbi:MAG: hypothetical protein ACI9HJ_000742 [Ulvibacter sp.]|jgi:hypothetical protein
MDASDYDKDGDIDLVLGSLAFEVVPKLGFVEKWMEDGIPFIVLENTFRQEMLFRYILNNFSEIVLEFTFYQ